MERFKVLTRLKVRFGDLDALGHVNAPKYFSYLEEGRLELFGSIKGKSSLEDIDFIVARLEGDFISPIHLNDELVLGTGITKIGNTSVSIYQELYANGKLSFVGRSVVVFYDFEKKTKKRVPNDVVQNAKYYFVED